MIVVSSTSGFDYRWSGWLGTYSVKTIDTEIEDRYCGYFQQKLFFTYETPGARVSPYSPLHARHNLGRGAAIFVIFTNLTQKVDPSI